MNLDHIVASLHPLAMEIEKLNLDPVNARKHDERNLDVVAQSLAKFKQRLPLVVQKQGMTVRAGNARLLAAKRLGWEHVAAVVVDESDVEAVAFAITDNRSADLAEWDFQQLKENLDALDWGALDADLESLGFTSSELEGMSASAMWDGFADANAAHGASQEQDGDMLVLRFDAGEADRLRMMLGVDQLTTDAVLASVALLASNAKCAD